MVAARELADSAKADAHDALVEGRRRTGGGATPATGAAAVLALQRGAGNAAVSALMAAKLRSPGDQAVGEIDAALTEVRRDDPALDTVEKGLKAAKAAGVPVEIEGPKPPASALAVTKTGFGPGAVAPKKPVPPPKKVPEVSPLTKAASARAKTPAVGGGRTGGAVGGGAYTVQQPPAAPAPAPLSADKLMQPPVPPGGVQPHDDPAFATVTQNVNGFAKVKKAHAPAGAKAKEAQDAALAPTDDLAGQAKTAKVADMDAQPPGTFDKQAFIAAVKTAIEAKSPKTLEEADDYKESGKAGEVKGEIQGMVGQGKEGESKDIETATDKPPDQSKSVAKPVTPMSQEQPGPAVQIPAAGAAPKPAPPEQTNLAAGKEQANQEMAEGGVSEQQLANSNEPEFQQALTDKKAAADHADKAPGEYRQQEQAAIDQHKEQAAAETAAGVTGMQGAKGAAIAKLVADKGKAKSKDETKRAEVTNKIQSIFTATEAEVKKILEGIDPKVDEAFTKGEADARSAFETYVAAKMSAYKEDRYSGWLGGLRWAKDKLVGMPDKVNEFYEAGRELYLKKMDEVISRVADIVGNDLVAAKQRIAQGKTEIASYVKTLSPDLQKIGAEASKEINDKFEELEDDVNSKQDSVVDSLASKYVEARKGLDDRIEELQAENKGLVDKAIGAIKAVINTIRGLVSMLTSVLAKAASVVGDIIKDPVGFLGNLISGIKGGILKFKDNILDHLRKGLMGWLFGALAEGGVELPETFDIKGIIKLLASIFGLTWTNIRNRIVKKIGEKAMAAAEKGVSIFQTLKDQGVAGLWQMLMDKLGDIKEMILDQVKDFVVTKIITAGITWLIGLLNPAAAFIKACKLIYDVVMFFVNNAERIAKFVNTILDSVADIVKGNVSAVVDKIDDVLGQMVPILIGFLASVIGIGGIGEKIRGIIDKLQKPVNKAIDFVVGAGLKLAGPLIRGLGKLGGKVKKGFAAGKAWVKGKAEAGKKWVKDKATAVRDWLTLRKTFSAADGTHALYWTGRGAAARLTVASTPTPVDGVLKQARGLIGPSHPQAGALAAAIAQQNTILSLKKVVEQSGSAGRQPVDVDALNKAMEDLVPLLAPLVPIVFPATAPPAAGTLPTWVKPFALVKLQKRRQVARVLSIDTTKPLTMVKYQVLRERTKPSDPYVNPDSGATGAPETISVNGVNLDWAAYQADPRNFYMGPTPGIGDKVGKQVVARMQSEGKIVGNQVRYARDARGNPLPPGRYVLYPLSECDMGHVIDTVTWWNTNGRFTGPQSPEVQKFMDDPDNYEIEPSGPNRLRGALLGGRGGTYLPSTK